VRTPAGDQPRQKGESGQITAMLVLFSICLLLAVIAVTDISGSYLRRQAAMSLADGAALSASDAAAAGGIYGAGDDGYVAFDPDAAAAAVDTYLQTSGAYERYPGLTVQVSVIGHTVRVYLTMPYQLPVTMPGVPDTATIHGTGAAEMPIY
jgi:hypothetical protein